MISRLPQVIETNAQLCVAAQIVDNLYTIHYNTPDNTLCGSTYQAIRRSATCAFMSATSSNLVVGTYAMLKRARIMLLKSLVIKPKYFSRRFQPKPCKWSDLSIGLFGLFSRHLALIPSEEGATHIRTGWYCL